MKISKKISFEVIKTSLLPTVILFLCGWGYFFYRMRIEPVISQELKEDLKKYIVTIFIICGVFFIQRIVGAMLGWYKENVAAKTDTKLDDKLIPLARKGFKVFIWVIAVLLILPLYKVNISALVASLGVGSLAIALAAQDTISNVISGFMIMIDAPFRIGDRIKLPSGEIVEVLDIGVRRSQFLSEEKAVIVVPNTDLSKSKIINYTYGKEKTTV